MKISQVLARAAKLVERGWHRGSVAVTADGQGTDPGDRRAISWCLVGAVQRVTKPLIYERKTAFDFLDEFLDVRGRLAGWNDAPDRTGPEVACWLQSAAEYAKVLGK